MPDADVFFVIVIGSVWFNHNTNKREYNKTKNEKYNEIDKFYNKLLV